MDSKSLSRLKECDKRLQKLILAVDEVFPVSVVCGHRGEEDQNRALAEKKSKLKFPDSKHNKRPSLAVDIVPDPERDGNKTISWADLSAFEVMCLTVESMADKHDIKIRLGRDFSFKDYPHVELI